MTAQPREEQKAQAEAWAKSPAGLAWAERNYAPRHMWKYYGVWVEDGKVVLAPKEALQEASRGAVKAPRKRFVCKKG